MTEKRGKIRSSTSAGWKGSALRGSSPRSRQAWMIEWAAVDEKHSRDTRRRRTATTRLTPLRHLQSPSMGYLIYIGRPTALDVLSATTRPGVPLLTPEPTGDMVPSASSC